MSLVNSILNLPKMAPWIIVIVCVFLLFLRSTYAGIAFVYQLKSRLMISEFRRRMRGLPARPYPKVIPRFPKTIIIVMIVAIIWGSLDWLKYFKIPVATPTITQSATAGSIVPIGCANIGNFCSNNQ